MGEREITARSDVYALGVVTYEMLSGDPPFTGSTAQAIVARMVTEPPRALRPQRHTIPEHVEAAVLTALEKLPADRWGSAAEFGEALGGTTVRRYGGTTARRGVATALPPYRPTAVPPLPPLPSPPSPPGAGSGRHRPNHSAAIRWRCRRNRPSVPCSAAKSPSRRMGKRWSTGADHPRNGPSSMSGTGPSSRPARSRHRGRHRPDDLP